MKLRLWKHVLGAVVSCGTVCVPTCEVLSEGIPEPPLIFYGKVTNIAGVRITAGTLTCMFAPSDGGPTVVATCPLTNINDQFSYLLLVPCESPVQGMLASTNALRLAQLPLTYTLTNAILTNPSLGQGPLLTDPAQRNLSLSTSKRGLDQRMDLAYGGTDLDSDNDGLPDWWEALYTTASNQADDTDGDGMTNWEEYRSGTNPTDPTSLFRFIDIDPHMQGGMLIRWSSEGGKKYTILRATGLSLNPEDYQVIQSGITSTPPANIYHDVSPPLGPSFYRLRIE